MQHLVPVPVRRLRIAGARIHRQRRHSGSDRAIWVAARNYRRDQWAQPDDAAEIVKLPHFLVERIAELTTDYPEEPEEIKDGNTDT